jgi:uncharacterized protein
MGEEKLTPKVELLIDGSPADASIMESIIVVRVHQHLEFADTIEVRLSNNDLDWTDGETFVEGTKLTVKFGYQETGTEQVCEGEIVRRDCVFPARGAGVDRPAPKPGGGFVHQSHVTANAPGPAVITLVAIDREHRLKRGVHSRTFIDMKDSEIVSQLAGEAGLSADVEDTKVKHRYVFQSSQTNLSFIRERAMLLNFEVDVDQKNAKLAFKSAKKKPTDGGELKWGLNLFRFDLRISAETQVSSVKVKGWDMHAKAGLTGSAAKTDIVYEMDSKIVSGSTVTEDHWGARSVLYTGKPIHVQGEADAMAVAYLNRLSMTYSEGEATCQGDPKLDAGVCITIDGVGIRAGGKFYVYKTLHHYEPGTGYTTQLSLLRSTERTGEVKSDPPPKKVSPRTDEPVETEDWVEFKIRSETGESLEGVGYTITFEGGKTEKGTLGADQVIKVEGIKDPGECKIELNQPDDLNPVG